jgi:hypothetical protein
MGGAIPPFHQYVFMAWYLVKHKENFTFLTEHHAMEAYWGEEV